MNDSLKFTGRFDKDASFDVQISTILINDDIVITTFPGEPFIQLQLDWKTKVGDGAPVPVRIHVARGHLAELRAGHQVRSTGRLWSGPGEPEDDRGRLGEAVMNKHMENMYRLTGLTARGTRPGRIQAGPLARHPGAAGQIGPIPTWGRSPPRKRTLRGVDRAGR